MPKRPLPWVFWVKKTESGFVWNIWDTKISLCQNLIIPKRTYVLQEMYNYHTFALILRNIFNHWDKLTFKGSAEISMTERIRGFLFHWFSESNQIEKKEGFYLFCHLWEDFFCCLQQNILKISPPYIRACIVHVTLVNKPYRIIFQHFTGRKSPGNKSNSSLLSSEGITLLDLNLNLIPLSLLSAWTLWVSCAVPDHSSGRCPWCWFISANRFCFISLHSWRRTD